MKVQYSCLENFEACSMYIAIVNEALGLDNDIVQSAC